MAKPSPALVYTLDLDNFEMLTTVGAQFPGCGQFSKLGSPFSSSFCKGAVLLWGPESDRLMLDSFCFTVGSKDPFCVDYRGLKN